MAYNSEITEKYKAKLKPPTKASQLTRFSSEVPEHFPMYVGEYSMEQLANTEFLFNRITEKFGTWEVCYKVKTLRKKQNNNHDNCTVKRNYNQITKLAFLCIESWSLFPTVFKSTT